MKPESTLACISVKEEEKKKRHWKPGSLPWVQNQCKRKLSAQGQQEKRGLLYCLHPQRETSASLCAINHFIRQRILLEFLFLVHGVAVGYDFPKAGDPVVGIIL